jgi:hypothetical protein
MSIFISLATNLMQSFHGAAFLVGGLAYLGYISLMVPAMNPESSSKEDAGNDNPPPKQRPLIRERLPWPLLSLFCLTLACYLMVLPPAEEQCPGEVEASPLEPVEPVGDPEGATPEQLVQDAHAAIDLGDDETGRVHLELCVAWVANDTSAVPLAELRAQLECHGELLEQGLASAKRAAAIASSGRRILAAAQRRSSEDPGILTDMHVEWARVSHGWLEVQYEVATQAIRSQKSISRQYSEESRGPDIDDTAKKSTQAANVAIHALVAAGATASPLKSALSSSNIALEVMKSRSIDGNVRQIAQLLKKRAASAVAVLGLVREARAVAAELRSIGSPEVLRKLRCPSEALARAEALAVEEATRQAKQKSDFRHKALFALGEYWSEKVVEESAEPRADEKWVLEEKASGAYIPADVAYAESLLAAGAATDGDDKADRQAMRALRFYQHAKLLAKRHHDAAAEWRYRAAAAIAVRYKRRKLAAHSLSRLAYLFIQRSKHADALKVLEEAKAHGGNALSMFLETMLLRSSGSLMTDKSLRASDDILVAVAGKLPSKALEAEREALHRAGNFWRSVAATDVWRCFQAENVAHLLICVICRLLFRTDPPVAANQGPQQSSVDIDERATEEEYED